jgi:hypothetical protein
MAISKFGKIIMWPERKREREREMEAVVRYFFNGEGTEKFSYFEGFWELPQWSLW